MKNILLIVVVVIALSSCNQKTTTPMMTENNLASKIDYANKVNNQVVFQGEAYKMILFAMKRNQELKPHSAPVDAPLYMLEGSAKITIGEQEHTLLAGDMITLPKDIKHGVYPITDCKFLLLK